MLNYLESLLLQNSKIIILLCTIIMSGIGENKYKLHVFKILIVIRLLVVHFDKFLFNIVITLLN